MSCMVTEETGFTSGEIPVGKVMLVPSAVVSSNATVEEIDEADRLFPPGMHRGTKQSLVKANIAEALYDENGALTALVSVHGDRMTFEGHKGNEYITSCTVPRVGMVIHMMKVRGKMREVLREQDPGWVIKFTDHQNNWRRTTAVHTSGRVVYYEGTISAPHLVHIKTEKGNHHYYMGRLSDEKMTHSWYPTGGRHNRDFLIFYDTSGIGYGPKIRTEFYDGKVLLFSGKRGEEYKTTETTTSGEIMEYLGERGNERRVTRRRIGCGDVLHYVGCRGEERKRKLVEENGNIMIYHGAKGQEYRKHAIDIHPVTGECVVTHYTGTRNNEMPYRKLLSSGEMEIYEHALSFSSNWGNANNARRKYRVKRIIHPDGTVATRPRIDGAEWISYDYPEETGESEANATKRQRVKDTARSMWDQIEQLTESGDVNEKALVAIGAHFKELNSAVEASVVLGGTN